MTAFLSIGTNMGDRLQNLNNAVDSLKLLPMTTVTEVSSVYETDPVGFLDQPDFYNICVEIETDLTPDILLGSLLGIEAALGRVRLFKNGPRIVDLDLLLYEGERRTDVNLTLPHPRMLEREFVLAPLCELHSMRNNDKYKSALKKIQDGKVRIIGRKIILTSENV